MTVAELVAQLLTLPQDALVMIYDDLGIDDARDVRLDDTTSPNQVFIS